VHKHGLHLQSPPRTLPTIDPPQNAAILLKPRTKVPQPYLNLQKEVKGTPALTTATTKPTFSKAPITQKLRKGTNLIHHNARDMQSHITSLSHKLHAQSTKSAPTTPRCPSRDDENRKQNNPRSRCCLYRTSPTSRGKQPTSYSKTNKPPNKPKITKSQKSQKLHKTLVLPSTQADCIRAPPPLSHCCGVPYNTAPQPHKKKNKASRSHKR